MRYTCPACNLRYCTLECFRSEVCLQDANGEISLDHLLQKHSNCSENFYKESLISEVSGRNDVDNEEKAKVLGMLRRLQESDEAGLEQTEDNTGNDLQIALEGLDIGKSCTKGRRFKR